MDRTVNLTDRDIDLISRVVDTEVPGYLARTSPSTYRAMVNAVVDTITNRVASEGYPDTVGGVLNQRRAFSRITGPGRLSPFGAAENAPPASEALQGMVRRHIENRVAGGTSTVGDAVNYANPRYSDASNLRGWINPMIEAGATRLGVGPSVHYHGNAPGAIPPDEYGIALNGVDNTAALANPAIPEARPETWTSAVPGAVERGLLDVPQDLQTPAVTPTEAYGLLASSMGQTPSLNLSGAGVQSPAADRMAGGMVANGLDGLRSGLLSSGSLASREAQLAEMQSQANLQNEVNMTRGMVSQDRPYQAYQPEQTTTNPAVGAIEAVSPTTQQTTPSLADAYRQMGQSMEQGGILGASGLKVRDPNDILGVGRLAQNPLTSPLDSLPAYNAGAVDTATIEGPVTTGAIQTPEAAVEQDTAVNTTPQATQKQPSRLGRFARNAGASLLGSMAGGALGGPVGALIGGTLAREALGTNNQQQGLLGDRLGGLLGGRGGQGAWAGVGTLNNIGSGAQAAYGAWGGPKGTTAFATDGSRITSLGGGLVSRIDRNGVETLFRDGQTVGGGGGTAGLLGGLFGGNQGDGSRSQADRARDSVGLY